MTTFIYNEDNKVSERNFEEEIRTLKDIRRVVDRDLAFLYRRSNGIKNMSLLDLDYKLLKRKTDEVSRQYEKIIDSIDDEINKVKTAQVEYLTDPSPIEGVPVIPEEMYYVLFNNGSIGVYSDEKDLQENMHEECKKEIAKIIFGLSLTFHYKTSKSGANYQVCFSWTNSDCSNFIIYPPGFSDRRVSNPIYSIDTLCEICNNLRNKHNLEPVRVIQGEKIKFIVKDDCKTVLKIIK